MWDGVRVFFIFYELFGGKDFLNGVKEFGIVDFFFKDWDELMLVDGVKIFFDVEF